MRGRVLILVGIVVLLIVVAVVFLGPTLFPAPQPAADGTVQQPIAQSNETPIPTATPIPFVELVIAVQELPRGFRIPPNAVELRPWPEISAPFNGITNLEDVVGRVARTDIFREQPILSNMIVDDLTDLARVGSDAAAILPSSLVAVAIPVDRITSIAYAIQDGDRVDVILSMLFVDVDESFQSISPNMINLFSITEEEGGTTIEIQAPITGRPDSTSLGPAIISPSESQRPRLVTQRTIQDAFIVHVGNFPLDGRYIGVPPTPTPVPVEQEETEAGATPIPPTPIPYPDIVTLGVTPQDAVVLTWIVEARLPVSLALRSATDTSRVPTEAVTMDYIMSTFGIEVPAKREFAIEPAVRSIRQLLGGDRIELTGQE